MFDTIFRWNDLNKKASNMWKEHGVSKTLKIPANKIIYRVSPETVWGLWIFGGTSIRSGAKHIFPQKTRLMQEFLRPNVSVGDFFQVFYFYLRNDARPDFLIWDIL